MLGRSLAAGVVTAGIGLLAVSAQAQIVVAPSPIAFGSFVQGQAVGSQTATVTSTVAWKATPGANWLTVTPASGQLSAGGITVTLAVITANLPTSPLQQTTTLVVSSTATTGPPVPSVTVNVTITYLPVLTTAPASFAYNALPGQTPPVQSFSIVANDVNNAGWTITPAVTTPKGGTWLNVSTQAGAGSLDTVIVLINDAGLAVGSYSGTVTVTPGSPGKPTVIPVTLVVNSGVPNVSLSSPFFAGGLNLNFAGPDPATQNFTLINTGGNQFGWTAAVATAGPVGINWLLASPKSGATAATITVGVNGVLLAPGTYTGTVTITVPNAVVPTLTVNVTYILSATTPVIAAAGVVNAATFLPAPVSPGQLVTIFGNNLATGKATAVAVGNQLPVSLGTTSVTIGGTAAPLIYVSPTQINAQVPYEVSGTTAQVVVTVSLVASQAVVVNVTATSTGIFSVDGTGEGTGTILHNSDFTLVTAANPANKGETVDIYCTGLGQVAGGGVTGMLALAAAATTATVGVTFGTTTAVVSYAGLAVGFAGLYQINATVPSSAAGKGGVSPVTIKIGATTSPSLDIFLSGH
ncbi:MAG TPA: IPT/TIG domain-containing protein [Bryobacterales bacterium]|nr:IPT/TIG domain-containing protein [Bryobacterales bacterium]